MCRSTYFYWEWDCVDHPIKPLLPGYCSFLFKWKNFKGIFGITQDAFVDQLDRNGATIKSYTLRGAHPVTIASIALGYGTNNAIEEFDVTFNYQYFETNTTT